MHVEALVAAVLDVRVDAALLSSLSCTRPSVSTRTAASCGSFQCRPTRTCSIAAPGRRARSVDVALLGREAAVHRKLRVMSAA